MKQPFFDKVLVSVDTEWKDEIQTKSGIVGVVYYNENYRLDGAQIKGVIRQLPRAGTSRKHYLLRDYNPLDLAQLRIGDTIYFHFNEITPDSRLDTDEGPLYTVRMEQIYCIVRKMRSITAPIKIIPIGGRILAEPIYDAEIDPVTNMPINKKGGLITKVRKGSDEQYNTRKAKLTHIGLALKYNKPVDIKPGDVFYYDKDADLILEIEGKKYMVMTQEDILMTEHEV